MILSAPSNSASPYHMRDGTGPHFYYLFQRQQKSNQYARRSPFINTPPGSGTLAPASDLPQAPVQPFPVLYTLPTHPDMPCTDIYL